MQIRRVQADEQDDGLGFFDELAFGQFVQAFGNDVEDSAEGDVRGLDGGALGVAGETRSPFVPTCVCPSDLRVEVLGQVPEDADGRQDGQRPGSR